MCEDGSVFVMVLFNMDIGGDGAPHKPSNAKIQGGHRITACVEGYKGTRVAMFPRIVFVWADQDTSHPTLMLQCPACSLAVLSEDWWTHVGND